MTYNSTQFWHSLPGDSPSPGCHLSFWLISYRSEVPMTPSVSLINLLEQLTELRETFYLLDYWLIKRYNSGIAKWKRYIRQGNGEGHKAPMCIPSSPISLKLHMLPTWKLSDSHPFWFSGGFITQTGFNHWPLVIEPTSSTSSFSVVHLQSRVLLCNPIDCSMLGFPVLHYLFAQTHIHWVGFAIQPSLSSVTHFSSCPQSFPASGSFPTSWLFALGGPSTGASASAPVLPMTIQCWFPLGLAGLISLLSKGLWWEAFPSVCVHAKSSLQLCLTLGYPMDCSLAVFFMGLSRQESFSEWTSNHMISFPGN